VPPRTDGDPDLPRLRLGTYPTPVRRLESLSSAGSELWVKDDGQANPEYGGNKVRKLELVLARALARGAKRLVVMGAAGSHQVLATALFGKKLGLPTAAVLFPQPWSEHAEQTFLASLALGVEPHPARSMALVAAALPRVLRPGDYLVAPGASSITGTLGFLLAVRELVDQIREGLLPEPELIVAPLGSGGTVAGLLAGVLREGLRSRVIGVDVAMRGGVSRAVVLGLSLGATRRDAGSAGPIRLRRQLDVDASYLGPGYAHPTAEGAYAARMAAGVGLTLDPTYTQKAFAKALCLVGLPPPGRPARDGGRPQRVLYWHTLSAAPLGPLIGGARELPPALQKLLIRSHSP
jgi:D-cysteine desulfhydrase